MTDNSYEGDPIERAKACTYGNADCPQCNDPTLSDVLAGLGIRHERDRETETDGRRAWYMGGRYLGRFDVTEGWKLMRAMWDGL